jgi:uncharacterized delta-60 repeat protein
MSNRKQNRGVRKMQSAVFEALETRQLMSVGSLDPTYGSGGQQLVGYVGNPVGINAICLDNSNHLYAVGTEYDERSGNDQDENQFVAMRFGPNGALDPSYGTNGQVDGGFGTGSEAQAYGCAVDSRGLILVGEQVDTSTDETQFFISRLGSNGFYDDSFGDGNGLAFTDFGLSDYSSVAKGVAIDSNGNYWVGGSLESSDGTIGDVAIAEVDTNGNIVDTQLENFGGFDTVTGIAIDSNNDIIVSGNQIGGGGSEEGFVARFLSNGDLDSSFNGGGVQFVPGSSSVQGVKTLSNNQIVIAGNATDGGAFVQKLNTDGSVASSNFFEIDDGTSNEIQSVDVRPDGKVVTAGYGSDSFGDADFHIEQFNSNLTFDSNFGTAVNGGYQSVVDDPGSDIVPQAVAYDGDGRVFVAGENYGVEEAQFACLTSAEGPYTGQAPSPGQVFSAANFDYGGQGVGYDFTETENAFGAYRATGVAISYDSVNGNTVNNFGSGEWMRYTVDVPQTGYYETYVSEATPEGDQPLDVSFDGGGNALTSDTSTGSWSTFQTAKTSVQYLTAGTHVLRLTAPDGAINIQSLEMVAEHAPVISSLSASAGSVTEGSNVTLTAHGVSDADGNLSSVRFYRESKSGNVLIATDNGSSSTDSTTFSTSNLAPGTYTFFAQAVDTTGLTSNDPSTTVTVSQSGSITGSVFNDANGNGSQNSGESGLKNWTIDLDTEKNGVWKTYETSTTNSSGAWSFSNVPLSSYRINEVNQSGWRETTAEYDLITLSSKTPKVTGELFGNTTSVGISGTVFNDANKNGKKDSNEKGLSGWTVYLDTNNSGKYVSSDPHVTTDSNGNFTFLGLKAGTYIVRVVAPKGWTGTTPSSGNYLLNLSSGQLGSGVLFGEHS